jgi:hypothetical protein
MEWTGGFPSPLWSGSTARSYSMPAHTKSAKSKTQIAVIGIDIGKNVFHLIGLDRRGAIVLKCKLSRSQLENRLANMPACLIGMEAYLSRRLIALGHDARLMPAKYVKPFLKGHKNDYRDAEANAEAVQRPTMRFVATKTVEQLDLQALHRVRARLVRERTATVNEVRAFLLERGIAVAKGIQRLRKALPEILARHAGLLLPRMIRIIEAWPRIGAGSTIALRKFPIQAARVVLIKRQSWERYGLKPWIEAAARRLHSNKLAIALANKLARIAWSVLRHGRNFEVRHADEPQHA